MTGASGFVGRALLSILSRNYSYQIHATSRKSRRVQSILQYPVSWHECNLLDPYAVTSLIRSVRPEILVQLAWCSEHGKYWNDMANIDWLYSNLNICREFISNGGRRIIFIGSSAEYLWSSSAKPLNEITTELLPSSLYGSSKLSSFIALKSLLSQRSTSWAWIRLFNPFGPYEKPERLIPSVILRLLSNKQIAFDSGCQIKDFMHVNDVSSAIACIIESEIQGPINVAHGDPISVQALVSDIATLLNKSDHLTFTDSSFDPINVIADVTRLREEVGWSPGVSIRSRLQQTCDWWLNHFS